MYMWVCDFFCVYIYIQVYYTYIHLHTSTNIYTLLFACKPHPRRICLQILVKTQNFGSMFCILQQVLANNAGGDTVDGRNLAPLGIYKNLFNNGIFSISTGLGFLPSSTVSPVKSFKNQ